ncbi:MAG: VWA domain-containing protein [Deltaproteobacteria bacterium]|nr:VWA domain-containing protein [Deltaproteobacteria bacterium]
MKRSLFALTFVGAVFASAAGCTDTKVEPLAANGVAIDDRLTIHGTVCTRAPDPDGFPVKVVFVIDKSGSMCITDPPGSQSDFQSICQTFAAGVDPASHPDNYCEPDGNAHPGRACAIYQLLEQFKDKPNVEAALVPFETKISGEYPANGGFAPVNDSNFDAWVTAVNDMQGTLGQGTDYQGAFAEAYNRVSTDILNTPKGQRPRTRYVVVFLTDGTPFPRCAADDYLPPQDYASVQQPDLIWPDSPGAGCTTPPVMNPTDPNGCYCNADQDYLDNNPVGTGAGDFTKGTDRNQNYQILDTVDRIMKLKKDYDVADINIHSLLLWNTGNISTLGLPEQQDLFGDMGNVADPVQAAHDVAEHLLREISEVHGNGTYQEFHTVAEVQLGSLDYTSLAAPFVLKSLIVDNTSALPRPTGQIVDTDGDGLPDDLDTGFVDGTSKFDMDSDGDGFNDGFEFAHQQQGFIPANDPDPRGCEATAQHQPDCACQDTDGDGLSECAEKYLKSDPNLMDSDTDGIPDGLEAKYGMDPSVAEDPLKDSDGDGVPDIDEIKAHTDPHVADPDLAAREGYRYQITPHDEDGGITCYDYSVSNIRLVTTQSSDNTQHGYNRLYIYFNEAPKSNVEGDYGEWKIACAKAQYAPPSVRHPQGPDMEVDDASFTRNDQFVYGVTADADAQDNCVETP